MHALTFHGRVKRVPPFLGFSQQELAESFPPLRNGFDDGYVPLSYSSLSEAGMDLSLDAPIGVDPPFLANSSSTGILVIDVHLSGRFASQCGGQRRHGRCGSCLAGTPFHRVTDFLPPALYIQSPPLRAKSPPHSGEDFLRLRSTIPPFLKVHFSMRRISFFSRPEDLLFAEDYRRTHVRPASG